MKQQILVIDGSKAIRFLLNSILGSKYQVITAQDGCSAVQWLRKRNLPDLIITDSQLPDMKNWELVEFIKTSGLYGDIPVVVLSSLDKDETGRKCDYFQIDHFFTKPFNPQELQKAVTNTLGYAEIASHMHPFQLKVG